MGNNKDSERKDEADFLWEEFKIRVETYKSYLTIALQANVFFYVTTGGVLAFYLSSTTKALPFLEFLLLLPILIGAVLGGIFLHAAQLQKKASVIIEEIRKDSSKKGHEIAELPDINLLYLLLNIFGGIFILVALALTATPLLLSIAKTGNSDNIEYNYPFTFIAGCIVILGGFFTRFFDNTLLNNSHTSDFSAEERALEKAGILRLPENENLPESPWEKNRRNLNDETFINALIKGCDEPDTAFWDARAISRLCLSETSTNQSSELKRKYPKIVILSLAENEIKSELERLKSNNDLTDEQKKAALGRWKAIYKSSRIVEATERVVKLKNNLSENYELQALDLLQLAAALVWCQKQPRRRLFVTVDEKLAEAAEKEGFTKISLT